MSEKSNSCLSAIGLIALAALSVISSGFCIKFIYNWHIAEYFNAPQLTAAIVIWMSIAWNMFTSKSRTKAQEEEDKDVKRIVEKDVIKIISFWFVTGIAYVLKFWI